MSDIDPSIPSPPPELRGLDPGELLLRGLNTVCPSGDPANWTPPTPEELSRLLPQYQIESMLGYGGMGAVYKGCQPNLDRFVAIKLLPAELSADEQFVSRFRREARTLAKLQHPGIVAVYDFGQTSEGHLYFVMEYVDGTDLRRILQNASLNPDQALELIAQICEALHYAHLKGVIHRDIKPANILITGDGRAKLADFGLARPVREEDTGGLTRSNMVVGTPDYMAPEQRAGHSDHRADIFALGIMLYEMLTGQRPQGAFEPASSRVQVDVRIDEVVLKALQQEPDRRYQQASDMKTDVDHIRTTVVEPAAPVMPPVTPPPDKEPRYSSPNLIAFLAAGVVALLAIAGFFIFKKGSWQAPANPHASNTEKTVAALPSSPGRVEGAGGGNAPISNSLTFNYLKEKSAKLEPKGYKQGSNPVMETDDPNDVFLGKPVYFDLHTGNEVHFAVDSATPLTKLIYTGVAFWDFSIQVLDRNGLVMASGGPYNYRDTQKTFEVSLPGISHFEVVITDHAPNWLLVEQMRFAAGAVGQAQILGESIPFQQQQAVLEKALTSYNWTWSDPPWPPKSSMPLFHKDGVFAVNPYWHWEITGPRTVYLRLHARDAVEVTFDESFANYAGEFVDGDGRKRTPHGTRGPLIVQTDSVPAAAAPGPEAASAGQSPAAPGVPPDALVFNGKWYRVYLERATWDEARKRCISLGGQLASVPDEPTWGFIRALAKDAALWLGATDEGNNGAWRWIDDTPFTFNAWHRGQPDNFGGQEHYLETASGGWNDHVNDALSVAGFICEWKGGQGQSRAAATPAVFAQNGNAETTPVDPIVGKWKEDNDDKLRTFSPDGSATGHGETGHWKCLNKGVPRKYEIRWHNGRFIDTVEMLNNGTVLSGKNQYGDIHTFVVVAEGTASSDMPAAAAAQPNPASVKQALVSYWWRVWIDDKNTKVRFFADGTAQSWIPWNWVATGERTFNINGNTPCVFDETFSDFSGHFTDRRGEHHTSGIRLEPRTTAAPSASFPAGIPPAAIQSAAPQPGSASLEQALESYTWSWTNGNGKGSWTEIRFRSDGTVTMWAGSRPDYTTRWEAKGPRIVQFIWNSRVFFLTFDDAFSRFDARREDMPGVPMWGVRKAPVSEASAMAKQEAPAPSAAPAKADQSAIDVLSQQGPNAMAWALASLDRTVPGNIRENVTSLKESLLDDASKGPAANPAACNLGARFCDALLSAMTERETALARAGVSAAVSTSGALGAHRRDFNTDPRHLPFLYDSNWPVYERELHEEAGRKEEVAKDQNFFNQRTNLEWIERAALLRRNAEAIYGQFRAAARQAAPAKPL